MIVSSFPLYLNEGLCLFFQTLDDNETLSLLDRYRYLDLVPCTANELGCMGYKVCPRYFIDLFKFL